MTPSGLNEWSLLAGGVLSIILLIALQPSLITVWMRHGPSEKDAYAALSASLDFQRWRSRLLSDIPSSIRTGRRVTTIVMDAWTDGRLVLLVATIRRYRVKIVVRDAETMRAVPPGDWTA